jgi:hypothetical protein
MMRQTDGSAVVFFGIVAHTSFAPARHFPY